MAKGDDHMAAVIGYARISTPDQLLDRQLDQLRENGCERVFAEAASGKRGANRPQWSACLSHLRSGDTLVVVELSRLGRNTGDLGRLLDDLADRGIELKILNLGADTGTASGRLVFTIIGAVAEMERQLLVERTQSGLAAARARGRHGGRRRSYTQAQEREAKRLYDTRQLTADQIAGAVGSSRSTIYRYLRLAKD
jgi:DNA invertase Pin-like site-specific DNA recombinase